MTRPIFLLLALASLAGCTSNAPAEEAHLQEVQAPPEATRTWSNHTAKLEANWVATEVCPPGFDIPGSSSYSRTLAPVSLGNQTTKLELTVTWTSELVSDEIVLEILTRGPGIDLLTSFEGESPLHVALTPDELAEFPEQILIGALANPCALVNGLGGASIETALELQLDVSRWHHRI